MEEFSVWEPHICRSLRTPFFSSFLSIRWGPSSSNPSDRGFGGTFTGWYIIKRSTFCAIHHSSLLRFFLRLPPCTPLFMIDKLPTAHSTSRCLSAARRSTLPEQTESIQISEVQREFQIISSCRKSTRKFSPFPWRAGAAFQLFKDSLLVPHRNRL